MTPKSLIAPARLARRPVLATQSDARLVDLVRAGYDPAFEAIVTRYRTALLRYVERFLPRERAEDALQQSFVNAYEALQRSGTDINLRPWLYRIAHNAALNGLRDQALRTRELPEDLDGVERPEEALERVQGVRELLTAVQALPERQRDAILLRELEGRSYDEIAEQLGVSGGSVRQLLNRARNTLRAGATAVTPTGLLLRLPWETAGEPMTARVAELGVGAGAGAVAAKLCATALVTGAVVGGVAVTPTGGGERAVGPERAAAPSASSGGAVARSGLNGGNEGGFGSGGGSGLGSEGSSGLGGGERSGPGGGPRSGGDSNGPGSGGDSSGPGSGDDSRERDDDSSGPGSGGDSHELEPDDDSSGPGSGSDDSSGSGSNSGSGSDSSGKGSGGDD